jgi:hypothetical protein
MNENLRPEEIQAAMIAAILDTDDPCDLAYPVRIINRQFDNSNTMPDNIILAAYKRMQTDGMIPNGDPGNFVTCILDSAFPLTVTATLIINIGARQFLVSSGYMDGKGVPVVRELGQPVSFEREGR